MKTFSIVAPIHHKELNLPETVPQLLSLAEKLPECCLELILADDGSKDNPMLASMEFRTGYPENIADLRGPRVRQVVDCWETGGIPRLI